MSRGNTKIQIKWGRKRIHANKYKSKGNAKVDIHLFFTEKQFLAIDSIEYDMHVSNLQCGSVQSYVNVDKRNGNANATNKGVLGC